MEYVVDTLQSFIDAISQSDCDSIKFADNIVIVYDKVEIAKNIEIDLCGYTLQIDESEGLTVSDGNVTLKNGKILGSEDNPVVVSGLTSCLKLAENLSITIDGCAMYIKKRGKMVIDGAVINCINTDQAAIFVEGSGIAKDNSYLELASGTITSENQTAVSVAKRGKFVMLDGRVETNVKHHNLNRAASVYVTGNGTIMEMSGGELYSSTIAALGAAENATIIVSGGKISTDSNKEPVVKFEGTGVTFEMGGGTISGPTTSGIHLHMDEGATVDITITDGTISVPVTRSCISADIPLEDAVLISGGRFHGKLDTSFISPDSTYETDEDGYLIVTPIVESNSNESVPEQVFDASSSSDSDDSTSSEASSDTSSVSETSYSGILSRPTYVYGTCNKHNILTQLVGAITIVSEGHKDSQGNLYSCIKYVLPGNGKKVTGYVLTSAISRGGEAQWLQH